MGASAGPARDAWILTTLKGLLTAEQLGQLDPAGEESCWEAATRRGWTSDDAVLAALSRRFGMPIADLSLAGRRAVELVPERLARKYRVVPLNVSDSVLDVATADPCDLDCERTLAFALGRTVQLSLAAPWRIGDRLDELYRPGHLAETVPGCAAGSDEPRPLPHPAEGAEPGRRPIRAAERPVVRLVDRLVAEGIQARASDIHLEPEEGGVAVRYRIDGVLRQVTVLPKAAGVPLVSRVKIMARLDIADRLRPQDGRAHVAVGGTRVDLRVSTLPASQGEKVVIRILDQRATVLSLDGLGLHRDEMERVQSLLQAREGIVLVTGPTGSGKTTTLYSMLRSIQARGVNIVTVEDPVEYRLRGVVQVQVHEKAGLTFPAALRSILRQDPDVILVGEVRDHETAVIAVQASLTGHLVLTTLHTIDAASSVTRLVDVGIESYKIAAAIRGIVAQRLVRRLCQQCRALTVGPLPDRLRAWFPAGVATWRPVGCDACSHTGYRGRLAVMEVLIAGPEIERRIAAGEAPGRIAALAREAGMRGLWESGVQHVVEGGTSVDELLRVLEPPPGDARAPAAREALPPARGEGHFVGGDGAVVTRNGEGPRVLLATDEDALRAALRELLERDGFTAVMARLRALRDRGER